MCKLTDYNFIVIDYNNIWKANMTNCKRGNRLSITCNRLYLIAIGRLFFVIKNNLLPIYCN